MKSSQYVSLLTLTLVAAGSMTLMAAVSPDTSFKSSVNNFGATCPKIRLGMVGSTAMSSGISSMSVSADGEGCPFSSKSSGSCCSSSASATASTSSCCSAGASVATAIAAAAKGSAASCCSEGAACCAEGAACCEGAKKNTAAAAETVVASPETGAAATTNN